MVWWKGGMAAIIELCQAWRMWNREGISSLSHAVRTLNPQTKLVA